MLNVELPGRSFIDRDEIEPERVVRLPEANPPEIRDFRDRALLLRADSFKRCSEGMPSTRLHFHKSNQPPSARDQVDIVPPQAVTMRLYVVPAGDEIRHRLALASKPEHLPLIFPFLGWDEFAGSHAQRIQYSDARR